MKRVLFYPFERIVEIDTLKPLNDRYYWVTLGNSLGCKDSVCIRSSCKDCDRKTLTMTTV